MPDFMQGGPSTARAAIAHAAAKFTFSATPRLDAELLLAHVLGITREALLLSLDRADVPAAFAELVERRAAHEPVAYLVGTRAFWTIDLHVGPGVLIPRPDSETLVAAAVAHFVGTTGPRTILDLGTGPGTLLLAALAQWPKAHGLGIDSSERAHHFFELNAAALDMHVRARFKLGDWANDTHGEFDLVLCNPPYIATDEGVGEEVRHEPPAALYAGADGLDDYRRLAPQMARLLAPEGVACIEVGWTQAAAVTVLLEAQGFRVALRRDLAGHDRCLVVTP